MASLMPARHVAAAALHLEVAEALGQNPAPDIVADGEGGAGFIAAVGLVNSVRRDVRKIADQPGAEIGADALQPGPVGAGELGGIVQPVFREVVLLEDGEERVTENAPRLRNLRNEDLFAAVSVAETQLIYDQVHIPVILSIWQLDAEIALDIWTDQM